MGEIVDLLNNTVFPIGMCIILCYYVKLQGEKQDSKIDKIEERHDKEVTKITEAVNNNTKVIERLIAKLFKGDDLDDN